MSVLIQKLVQKFDAYVINHFRKLEVPLARTAIFVVYFWFGFLKLLGVSPAGPLVQALFEKTIWFMHFSTFYLLFSLFEMLIGILFLVRGLERLAIFLLSLHLVTTVLPLFLLPQIAWQGFLVPTLEGQYIIKNILIAAIAVVVGSKLVPTPKQ
jgi:uncharacterized membrane protein YkgB